MSCMISRERVTPVAFSDLLSRVFESPFEPSSYGIAPLNVRVDGNNVYVQVELPGVSKDEVTIDYHKGVLSIAGEKRQVQEEGADSVYREISVGQFKRAVQVGEIEFEKAQAEYKDGVLKITLPKSEETKARKLTIQ